jgi:hypothetical protein
VTSQSQIIRHVILPGVDNPFAGKAGLFGAIPILLTRAARNCPPVSLGTTSLYFPHRPKRVKLSRNL